MKFDIQKPNKSSPYFTLVFVNPIAADTTLHKSLVYNGVGLTKKQLKTVFNKLKKFIR